MQHAGHIGRTLLAELRAQFGVGRLGGGLPFTLGGSQLRLVEPQFRVGGQHPVDERIERQRAGFGQQTGFGRDDSAGQAGEQRQHG
ncbi:MAG: hypothetical protein EBU23_13520 [Mycobacteriaceae bacterium]|nr:hypothetical protein [Mycobacteriaceae bacterium]